MIDTTKRAYPLMTIALDLTDMDEALINYSSLLTETFKVKEVELIHVVPIIFPEDARGWAFNDFLELDESIPKQVQNYLDEKITEKLSPFKGLKTEVKVLDGQPYWVMMNHLNKQNADLLIVGKKELSGGSGLTARRVARNTNCAICFVPANAAGTITNILVPIDFSKHAARALINAMQLRKQYPEAKIRCLHVIDIPVLGMNPDLKTAELNERLRRRADTYFGEFMNNYSLSDDGIDFDILLTESMNIARVIVDYAADTGTDLIVQGGVGHNIAEGILFGSVTEKLVTYEHEIPVLVIR